MIEVKLQFGTAQELVEFFSAACTNAKSLGLVREKFEGLMAQAPTTVTLPSGAIIPVDTPVPTEAPKEVAKETKKAKTPTPTPAPTPEPVASTQPTAATSDAASPSALDYARDIKPNFLGLVKLRGPEAGRAILDAFGFKVNLLEAKAEQYPAILQAIKEAYNG